MEQDLGWWAHVLLDGWRNRPGPRYQKLSAAILDAIDARTLREGRSFRLSGSWPLPSA